MLRSFILAKIMREQAPPSEAMPHVQHILADQADQIGALETKIASLQRQITALLEAQRLSTGNQ